MQAAGPARARAGRGVCKATEACFKWVVGKTAEWWDLILGQRDSQKHAWAGNGGWRSEPPQIGSHSMVGEDGVRDGGTQRKDRRARD